ncbi:g12614 [Coccomyxa viridis]|uniref:G12614 protein n=1 Tax=Coccomyxa viridis TaxID=1274662 RepID=A0ABP1GAR7_9CHLO
MAPRVPCNRRSVLVKSLHLRHRTKVERHTADESGRTRHIVGNTQLEVETRGEACSNGSRLLFNTAAYGYQDTNPASVQSYDSTSYQAQQQPVQQASTASSNSDSLPSFELPSLPQIQAFFDSLPKPPSLGPGPFDSLFGPAPAPAPDMALVPMAAP